MRALAYIGQVIWSILTFWAPAPQKPVKPARRPVEVKDTYDRHAEFDWRDQF